MAKYSMLIIITLIFLNLPAQNEQTPPVLQKEQPKLISFPVVLDPLQRTHIFPEIQAKILEINYKLGQPFKKDDVLIQLEDKVFKANYEKAQAKLARSMTDVEAKQELYKEKISSLLDLKDAEASLAEAEADLELAAKNLKSTQIVAPYDGKVVDVFVHEYEIPQSNKEMIEIVDDTTLVAKLLVPSSLLQQLHVGMPIEIDIEEVGQKVIAKVVRIGSVIEAASSTLKIEAEVDNSRGRLKAGMSGQLKLPRIP